MTGTTPVDRVRRLYDVSAGRYDRTIAVPERDVLDLPPASEVRIVRVPGDHGIAYNQPELIADLLLEQLDAHHPT